MKKPGKAELVRGSLKRPNGDTSGTPAQDAGEKLGA